uniref:RNase H domain-containing protein n=1 Tax=Rhodnius prolixus TaxID=13249 RepID=T1HY85_RHOPR
MGVCINLLWVKGHCSIKENEIVNKLAKEATNSGKMVLNSTTVELDYHLERHCGVEYWLLDEYHIRD